MIAPLSIGSTSLVKFIDSWYQYHQHSMSSFFCFVDSPVLNFTNILQADFVPLFFFKKIQFVSREKLCKKLLYKKTSRKMLLKLTISRPSISSTLNTRVFRTNVILAAFFYICTYIKKLPKRHLYEKFVRKNIVKIDNLQAIFVVHSVTFR